jgi:hypothetical protein
MSGVAVDWSTVFMLSGFVLAAYSIIANDVIQTLGTFLSSNHSTPWWVLWIFAACILAGGSARGLVLERRETRLTDAHRHSAARGLPLVARRPAAAAAGPHPVRLPCQHDIPDSERFLQREVMTSIVHEVAAGLWRGFRLGPAGLRSADSPGMKQRFLQRENNRPRLWMVLQWISTGFLWSQWLIQDLANIFVYVPRQQKSYEIAGAVLLLSVYWRFYSGSAAAVCNISSY